MKDLDQMSSEYRFMKARWRRFLCHRSKMPDRWMTSKPTGESRNYDDLLKSCLRLSGDLSEAYEALQSEYGRAPTPTRRGSSGS